MFGNPFSGFKLNTEGLPVAEEHQIRIGIKSDYKWGSGWTETQAKRFENIVYTQLEECGPYKVKEIKGDLGCPHLVSIPYHGPLESRSGSKIPKTGRLDLYMHPMEFTGFATPEDTKRIMEILKSCPEVIYEVKLTKDIEVYDLNDSLYRKLILSQAKEIADIVKSEKEKGNPLYDIGFDFAKACRLPRYGDASILSSGQVDIETVENIAKIAEALGYFEEKNIDREEDDEKEM